MNNTDIVKDLEQDYPGIAVEISPMGFLIKEEEGSQVATIPKDHGLVGWRILLADGKKTIMVITAELYKAAMVDNLDFAFRLVLDEMRRAIKDVQEKP